MAIINIIAGPPGVGKSTSGENFIDPELDILNQDEMRFKYKAKGFPDYNEYSTHRARDIVRQKLIRDEDFALELNLGFERQWDYALTLKKFSTENQLNIILFFTDDIQLCFDRAKKRHENGLHLVTPDTIRKMYENTIPLLRANFPSIDSARFVHSDEKNIVSLVAIYHKENNDLQILSQKAQWFNKELAPFIRRELRPKQELKQSGKKNGLGGPKI